MLIAEITISVVIDPRLVGTLEKVFFHYQKSAKSDAFRL